MRCGSWEIERLLIELDYREIGTKDGSCSYSRRYRTSALEKKVLWLGHCREVHLAASGAEFGAVGAALGLATSFSHSTTSKVEV